MKTTDLPVTRNARLARPVRRQIMKRGLNFLRPRAGRVVWIVYGEVGGFITVDRAVQVFRELVATEAEHARKFVKKLQSQTAHVLRLPELEAIADQLIQMLAARHARCDRELAAQHRLRSAVVDDYDVDAWEARLDELVPDRDDVWRLTDTVGLDVWGEVCPQM